MCEVQAQTVYMSWYGQPFLYVPHKSLLPSLFTHAFFCTNNMCLVWSSYLYQIAHLGDDDDEPEFSSSMPLEEGVTFFFDPRALRNLVLVDELDSLAPIMSCQVKINS